MGKMAAEELDVNNVNNMIGKLKENVANKTKKQKAATQITDTMTKSVKGSVFDDWKENVEKIKSAEEVFKIRIPEFQIEKKKADDKHLQKKQTQDIIQRSSIEFRKD